MYLNQCFPFFPPGLNFRIAIYIDSFEHRGYERVSTKKGSDPIFVLALTRNSHAVAGAVLLQNRAFLCVNISLEKGGLHIRLRNSLHAVVSDTAHNCIQLHAAYIKNRL